jgi:hypothetical protein
MSFLMGHYKPDLVFSFCKSGNFEATSSKKQHLFNSKRIKLAMGVLMTFAAAPIERQGP